MTPRWLSWILAVLLAQAWAPSRAQPRVEVFTDRGHPVRNVEAWPGAVVYRLDALAQALEEISTRLPANEEAAASLAIRRLQATNRARLLEAAQGLALAALEYRIDRYPAIVVDGRAVIYGVTDLALARRIFEESRGARP